MMKGIPNALTFNELITILYKKISPGKPRQTYVLQIRVSLPIRKAKVKPHIIISRKLHLLPIALRARRMVESSRRKASLAINEFLKQWRRT